MWLDVVGSLGIDLLRPQMARDFCAETPSVERSRAPFQMKDIIFSAVLGPFFVFVLVFVVVLVVVVFLF